MSLLWGENASRLGAVAMDATTTTCTVNTDNAATAVFEITVDVAFTGTVEALLSPTDTVWRQIPVLLSDGGALSVKAAGATLTLTSGDLIYAPTPGYWQVRLLRAGGTCTVKAYSHPADMTALMALADATGSVPTVISPYAGTPTTTTPDVATATNVTILAANASRKYLLIQNASAANIMISLSGATLSGIAPTATNKGIVLIPGASYENPADYITVAAITCWQASGLTINTIVVTEG